MSLTAPEWKVIEWPTDYPIQFNFNLIFTSLATLCRDDITSCQTSEDHSATTRIPFNPYLDSSVEKLEKRSTKSFEGARQLYYLESIKSVILGPSQYDSTPGQRVAT